ncbi:MAG: phytanoyl-CoA dioxygenase family protein [Pseudomonadota bacterium]
MICQNANLRDQFEQDGRIWFRNAISEQDLADFDAAVDLEAKAGQRVDTSPALTRALAPGQSLRAAIGQIDPQAKPVRIVGFNKSSQSNWAVPWHQDRAIAVADKAEVYGFRNWTKKSGTWHCEPPTALLDDMLFVRVHLDDSDDTNGAMRIAVGSHAKGIVPADRAATEARNFPNETCSAKRGDVLVLKMLTLHASSPAATESTRRVLRIDFTSSELPSPLRWLPFDSGVH